MVSYRDARTPRLRDHRKRLRVAGACNQSASHSLEREPTAADQVTGEPLHLHVWSRVCELYFLLSYISIACSLRPRMDMDTSGKCRLEHLVSFCLFGLDSYFHF